MPHPTGPAPIPFAPHPAQDETQGTSGLPFATVEEYIDAISALESVIIDGESYWGIDAADIRLDQFYGFALRNNISPDISDPQSSAAWFAELVRLEQETQTQASAPSRVEFASERNLRNQQAQSLQFERPLDKFNLLVQALIGAAPFMVNPDQEFFPGQQPGGPGQELARLLGVGFEPQRIPTAPLPLRGIEDELAALQ